MRRCNTHIRDLVAACLLFATSLSNALATPAGPVKDIRVDPAPCLAAAQGLDQDRTVRLCSALIDNGKTEKGDRIKALVARAAAFDRKDMIDRAISDYDGALRLDPAQADVHNARGELLRKKGDLPRAVLDFAAAVKLNPDHAVARANHRALAQEVERQGILKAVAGKPSFDCATARKRVQKAICADPELANLDREVQGAYARAVAGKPPQQARTLRREQEEYIARRNSEFGRPAYDLKKAMRERLQKINGVGGY